jgi:hypothetical protein
MIVPDSYGALLRESNNCHSKEDGRFCREPVGSIAAGLKRRGHGRDPDDPSKWKPEEEEQRKLQAASRWYSFPKEGDFAAARYALFPIDGKVGATIDSLYFNQGGKATVAYLKSLVPKMPEGLQPIFRLGGKTDGLANRNAANAEGLMEFIDLQTDGGDYKLSYAQEGRYLHIFGAKIRSLGEYRTFNEPGRSWGR